MTLDSGYIQHLHSSVKQAMDNFESSRFITPNGTSVPNVSRLPFFSLVLHHNVTNFEDGNGKRMRSVLANGLEKTREECCPNNLEL
jgi:hypothetical protein